MAGPEFYFALEFFQQDVPSGLLGELASHVLCHLGCAQDAAAGLPQEIEHAISASAADRGRPCGIEFRARSGRLDIVVSSNGTCLWRASRPTA